MADPIVLKRYERPQRDVCARRCARASSSLGYILMLLLISGLREFTGAGALMGTQVMKNALFLGTAASGGLSCWPWSCACGAPQLPA
ncbi:MAG: hypothetical protein ACLR7U_03535 [Ruthenibacterium lactatiformans]